MAATIRLWAIEHLWLFSNQLHLRAGALVPGVVVALSFSGNVTLQALLLAVAVPGSLAARVWLCNRRRSKRPVSPAGG